MLRQLSANAGGRAGSHVVSLQIRQVRHSFFDSDRDLPNHLTSSPTCD